MTEVPFEALPENIRQAALAASGDVPQYTDYFAATSTEWVTLPDGVQKVEIKVLNEGERRKYLSKINQDFTMNSRTKELKMKAAAGEDSKALIEVALVDWSVYMDGTPLPFSRPSLNKALDAWPPAVIDHIIGAIRDVNAWLKGSDDDLEAMQDELVQLQDRIEAAKASQGKA